MVDFVANLDRINAVFEANDGFIWRLTGYENDALTIRFFEDEFLIINTSIWESRDALFAFTYASEHVEIFTRRKEWFSSMKDKHIALWYGESGHEPTPAEAKQRLEYYNMHGDSPYPFGFKAKFAAEDVRRYIEQYFSGGYSIE